MVVYDRAEDKTLRLRSGRYLNECITDFLKSVGKGSEAAGVVAVYRAGWLVGAGQTLAVIGAGYGVYRLGRWGYEKLMEYLQQNRYIEIAGEVVGCQDTNRCPA